MNFGVIVFDGGRVLSSFLTEWRRVELFGTEDIAFLKDFASRMKKATIAVPAPDGKPSLDKATLERMVGGWINSIQFTQPRASLMPPEELLEDVAHRFVRQPQRISRSVRDRRAAASLAAGRLKVALEERFGFQARQLVKRSITIPGKHDRHRFDIGVANGTIQALAHALSFEGASTRILTRELEATAWAVDDVRQENATLPISVVVLPPKAESAAYDRAKHIFDGLHAEIIPEERVSEWAVRTAEHVNP